jgi:hypothetical protein
MTRQDGRRSPHPDTPPSVLKPRSPRPGLFLLSLTQRPLTKAKSGRAWGAAVHRYTYFKLKVTCFRPKAFYIRPRSLGAAKQRMKTLLQGRNQTQYLLSPVAYFRAPFRPRAVCTSWCRMQPPEPLKIKRSKSLSMIALGGPE